MELENVPFDVREMLGDTMKSLAIRARHKQIELLCRIDQDVPDYVSGDAHRLRQIITNLVGNALKFTDHGEVVLRVSLAPEPADDRIWLHFAVMDTGIGIAPEKQAAILRLFRKPMHRPRVDLEVQLRTHHYASIDSAYEWKSMGGKCRGSGSTFHVIAPYTRCAPQPRQRTPEILHGLRVLVVDDNQTNRTLLKEMLTNWGMSPRLSLMRVKLGSACCALVRQMYVFACTE